MQKIGLLSCLIFLSFPLFANSTCVPPSLNKKLQDYEIIAGNVAKIPTVDGFKGLNLEYSYSAKNKKSNLLKMDKTTGLLIIRADKKDSFDVHVRAGNSCGTVSTMFNVVIDEEV